MSKIRTCFTCRNTYSYCPVCEKDRLKPNWYFLFCSETCKAIDRIISSNTAGKMSDKEASRKLKELDLSQVDIKNDSVKKQIDELLKYKEDIKTVKRNNSKVENKNVE